MRLVIHSEPQVYRLAPGSANLSLSRAAERVVKAVQTVAGPHIKAVFCSYIDMLGGNYLCFPDPSSHRGSCIGVFESLSGEHHRILYDWDIADPNHERAERWAIENETTGVSTFYANLEAVLRRVHKLTGVRICGDLFEAGDYSGLMPPVATVGYKHRLGSVPMMAEAGNPKPPEPEPQKPETFGMWS